MPTHVSLTSIARRWTVRGFNSVLPGDLLPLLAFSLVGITIDGLAVLGASGREGTRLTGLLMVVSAPVLAVAAAFCAAHPRELPPDRRR